MTGSVGMWIAVIGLLAALIFTGVKCDDSANTSEATPKEMYRRKYTISVPEPLVCFPGFEDKLVEIENRTVLQDLYDFRLVKLHDVVPVLSTLSLPIFISMKILTVLLRYADKQWFGDFNQELVDVKIEASIARSEIAHLKAKIDTIYNRMSTILDDRYPNDVKIAELAVAVDKSEEVLNLFRDKDFIFRRHPGATVPFLVLFYGPCKILLQAAATLIPSKVEIYQHQVEILKETIEDYKRIAVNSRIDGLWFDKVKVYPTPWTLAKNVWNHQVWSFDYGIKLLDPSGGWGSCHSVKSYETYNVTESEELEEKLLENYVQQLKTKYDAFFESPFEVFKQQHCKKTCGEASRASISFNYLFYMPMIVSMANFMLMV